MNCIWPDLSTGTVSSPEDDLDEVIRVNFEVELGNRDPRTGRGPEKNMVDRRGPRNPRTWR